MGVEHRRASHGQAQSCTRTDKLRVYSCPSAAQWISKPSTTSAALPARTPRSARFGGTCANGCDSAADTIWATKGGPCRITSDTGTPNTQHTTPALSSTYPGPPARRPGLRSAHQTGSGRSFPLLDWLRVGIPSLEKNRLEASHESPRSIAEQASRQPARPCWRAHRFVPSCRGEARPIIVAARSVLSCVRRSCRTLAAVEAYTSTAQTTVDLDLLSSPFRLEFVQVSGAPIG
jgi:hypothetical protein